MTSAMRDFLEIPYDQLEEMNLEAKAKRAARTPGDQVREERLRYLTDEKRIKAVTVCFSDLEGRLPVMRVRVCIVRWMSSRRCLNTISMSGKS